MDADEEQGVVDNEIDGEVELRAEKDGASIEKGLTRRIFM